MSITGIRKSVNSIAFFVPAAALIGVSFLDSNQKSLAVVLMCANVGINAGSTIGSTINTIDLSPNHAGILMGIINTAANVVPILTPLLVGIIVKDDVSNIVKDTRNNNLKFLIPNSTIANSGKLYSSYPPSFSLWAI